MAAEANPENHPRPQHRRAGWSSLDGEWDFTFDPDDKGIADRWFEPGKSFDRTIHVPFPPESPLSGISETGFNPILWYRRSFDMPSPRPRRLRLHFGAVDYRASVWVNGRLAVEHRGGNTPFSAEIAHLLTGEGPQLVTVRAVDEPGDLQQPRGKQYWEAEPGYIWYHRTSGIWQTVWLEPLPAIAIDHIRWTPDVDRFGVGLVVRFDSPPPQGSRLRVALRGGEPAADLASDDYAVSGKEIRRDILFDLDGLAIRRRRNLLWSPDHPNLIAATLELVDGEGAVIDRVESYFGLRRIEALDGRFILNGIPTFLRMVLAQNYWPQSHLAAPDGDALRREVELARELGFNGVRIHQKVEDPRFLYWCDRLGMMVWAEMANAYVYSQRAAEMLVNEWIDVVRRDFNHPSIIAWVPLNESWGVPDLDRSEPQRHFVSALYHLTKALDPTRPVIANDGWQHALGDIFGIHDYAQDGETLSERYRDRETIVRTLREVRPHHHPLIAEGGSLEGQPIVISEFGGLAFGAGEGQDWFAYGRIESEEDLLRRYGELVDALVQSSALAGFCYTQLTDTGQEVNGLCDSDRKPKTDPARLRAITIRPSRAVPSEILDSFVKQEVEERRKARDPN